MSAPTGTIWLLRLIAGPTLWAITFTLVYSLHGAGCSLGWTETALGPLSLHRAAMGLAWLAGIAACLALFLVPTGGTGPHARLPRVGDWIGIVATIFTLAPLLAVSSC